MGRSQMLAVAILERVDYVHAVHVVRRDAELSHGRASHAEPEQPQFAEITKPLGEESTRMVLRHMAAEINRSVFWGYGALQIAMGAILFLLVWRQKPRSHLDVGVVATMLALSIILTVVITPWIVSLGRSIDFLPRNPPPPVMPRFWALHGSFTGLDGVKMLAGIRAAPPLDLAGRKVNGEQASLDRQVGIHEIFSLKVRASI